MNTLLEKATPRPWFLHRYDLIVDDTGGPIAEVEDSQANQELIVKAVNAYEPLVKALEEVLDVWTAPSDEAYRRIHKVLTGSESCEPVESPEREGGE